MGKMVVGSFLESFVGKRVLITGHTGFKGSWLAFLLNEIGAEVLGYALPPEDELNHFSLLGLDKLICHVEGDVRNGEKLQQTLCDFKPEFVFHLAAQALVRPSYEDPKTTFDTNIGGSVNLLEAVRTSQSVRALVYITSDKCYENKEWIWGYRENDVLGGRDPYSASKAAAEIVFSAYSRSFFTNVTDFGAASTRAGNVIGGGDWAIDRIIPDCIRSIQAGEPIVLRNPSATRPWQHVLEPISGYLLLASKLYDSPKTYSGAWNFGPAPSEVRTVKEVAECIVDNYGAGHIAAVTESSQSHEAQLLQLNCDKARLLLGWHPRWSVEDTLAATATWYKQVESGKPVTEVTRQQILEYFQELR